MPALGSCVWVLLLKISDARADWFRPFALARRSGSDLLQKFMNIRGTGPKPAEVQAKK